MWVILKKEFKNNNVIFGSSNNTNEGFCIDRVEESINDIKKGEVFFKCNVKN